MNPQVLMMTRSAVSASGTSDVAVLRQQAEHPLGVDQVLRAAQADEGERPFDFGVEAHAVHGGIRRNEVGRTLR